MLSKEGRNTVQSELENVFNKQRAFNFECIFRALVGYTKLRSFNHLISTHHANLVAELLPYEQQFWHILNENEIIALGGNPARSVFTFLSCHPPTWTG